MYSRKRARWWIERSICPEYQSAYDLIASQVPEQSHVVVDVGCGQGEMLKRLAVHTSVQVIGTDLSDVMLTNASRKLREIGRDVQVYGKPERLELAEGRVALVKDNV